MTKCKIWVDADSCPKAVREHLVSFSQKKQIPLLFVANHQIPCPSNSELFTMIICQPTDQAADDYIFENVKENDLVITRDIPFANRLIQKDICTINDRGTKFTKDNIKEKLSERDFSFNLAQLGLGGPGKNTYGPKEFKKFADCFDREIQKILIIDQYGPAKTGL